MQETTTPLGKSQRPLTSRRDACRQAWRRVLHTWQRSLRDSTHATRIWLDTERFKVRKVVLPYDVPGIVAMERSLYSGLSVSRNELLRWFDVHRDSTWVLVQEASGKTPERVLGALGFWPLTDEARRAMWDGKLDDDTLLAEHLVPNIVFGGAVQHPYWYVGAIEAAHEFRDSRMKRGAVAGRLYRKGLSDWTQSGMLAESLEIYAIAFTPEGESLLSSYQFEQGTAGRNGHCPYRKSIERNAVATEAKLIRPFFRGVDGDFKRHAPICYALITFIGYAAMRILRLRLKLRE